jgi:hypothetical protein
MQLKEKLAMAASALLGASAGVAQADDNPWKIDSAVLLYSEADSRVQAVEPVVQLSKDWGDEHISTFKLVIDSLTGASPNGAMKAGNGRTQIFTGPSGNSRYNIGPNETPLDDSFHDQRGSFSANWQRPFGEASKIGYGGNISSEFDFASVSLNTNYARDFNQKNSTLAFGLNVELDSIKPVGGIHEGLSSMPVLYRQGDEWASSGGSQTASSDKKTVADFLLGYTQIFNRRFLMQFNWSISQSSGYQSDPYKFLTVADSGNLIVNPDANNADGQFLYWYETRPEKRLKNSFFVQAKYTPGEDVIDVSYRYMSDDWGIKSSTVDARYRWEISAGWYLEPHWRWYTQSAADFYRPFLQVGIDTDASAQTALIEHASADPRLAEFDAQTMGFKIGKVFSDESEIALRLESYKQTSGALANAPIGSDLYQQESFAELSATWLQVNYSFRW